ncbi:tubulin polyglutamylase complex subunit 2-like [Pocillopora damicornis]|uniref:tubulin polyglutamylase complex subunit 2-like n=1 Tax=Pocillopora damicornis TaxID=46731 RepID=UPI000F553B8B|nr:tubulin polyglutamylase complex subunit 2-like [Pocillopora damicornis]
MDLQQGFQWYMVQTNTIILLLPSPPYWRQKLAKTVALGFKIASLSEQSRVRELFDSVTLGVVRSLEKKPGVLDFRLLDRRQAEKHIIFTWDLKNMCILPEDLRSFFLTTNGLLIQWIIKFDGNY